MNPDELYQRYQNLQRYVGWTDADARRVQSLAALLEPHLAPLIDDFYAQIDRHPDARKVITGGSEQVKRLKGTLLGWLRDLLRGPYDRDYVVRRWRAGYRHVEIGLDQVYANVALSRLRQGLLRAIAVAWPGDAGGQLEARQSLNTLLDLDLAIIEDAYQSEHTARRQRIERLAAIGQVAGGVAHELRNPLNVIKTSTYFLLNARNPAPEKKIEHLRRIERQVALADGVITALADFAKLPLPNARPFAVATCLGEALEMTPLPENVRVGTDGLAALPPALADPEQLRIVFANLIRNAREAMPQGGTLTIAGRPAPPDAVEVAIIDTGIGIPREQLERIMEPLYSTKARGLGLGLALVRAILEKNNGSLHLTSEPGQGSTFTVRLLAAPPEEDTQP
jgi:signal transduction histidine kinase